MNDRLSSATAEPNRYPTAREVVAAAMATGAAGAAGDAAVAGPKPNRFTYPCQDLGGNDHTLFVIPLGRRIAVVGPNGATAVLEEQALIDLGGQLDDAFMTDVPGGIMSMGSVDVDATSNVCTLEGTSLEVEVHAYATEALLHLFSRDGHITIPLDLDVVQKLRQMLSDAERVMLGVVLPNRPDDNNEAPEPGQEVRGSETAARIEKEF